MQLDFPIQQIEYLVDGELREWNGEFKPIYSPIFIRDSEGNYTRKLLGYVPLLTGDEALEALNAADMAYNNGSGDWPMATVATRIQCMQKFVIGMKSVKKDVVKLLMWEIGKSAEDAKGI